MHVSDEDRATRLEGVARLTRAGYPAPDIAVRLGCSRRQVTRDRRTLGISKPRAGEPTAEQIAEAERLLDDGASRAEVARTLGLGETTIRRRFPDRGWTPQQIAAHTAVINNSNRRRPARRLVDVRARARALEASGLTPAQIATTMHVSVRTVHTLIHKGKTE